MTTRIQGSTRRRWKVGPPLPPEQPEMMKLHGLEAWDDTPTPEELKRAFSGQDDHLYPRLRVKKQQPAQETKKVLPSSPSNSTKHATPEVVQEALKRAKEVLTIILVKMQQRALANPTADPIIKLFWDIRIRDIAK